VHIRLPPAELTPAKSGNDRPKLPRPDAAHGHPDPASHPGWDALVAVALLLGRHEAQQQISEGD
jgi:hypothetical protein